MKIQSQGITLSPVGVQMKMTEMELQPPQREESYMWWSQTAELFLADDSSLVLCSALVSTGRLRCHLQPGQVEQGVQSVWSKGFLCLSA